MNRIRAEYKIDELHNKGITGQKINIAVIDTGINGMDAELKDSCIFQYDIIGGRKYPYDDNGHGTHVAGIISAKGIYKNGMYKGIAPDSKIVSIKALDKTGKGSFDNFIKGIDFIIRFHKKFNIRVVNMSVGAPNTTEDSRKLDDAIDEMYYNGIVVVAAAGNNGPANGSVASPGNNRNALTVGAYDDNREIKLSKSRVLKNYSGRGPTNECVVKPEILADGYHIVSVSHKGGYVSASGTSMATPIVSGMISLLLSKYPDLSPKEVKKTVHDTAIDLDMPKIKQGWGKIGIQNYILRE